MEPKKISFGFMKTKKAEKPVTEVKKDYIDCVEEKSIKIVGGEEIKEAPPLVIPMKPNTLITAERLKQIAEKVESALEEPKTQREKGQEDIKPENETLDQMAVRELLQDAKEVKVETAELTVPVPSKFIIDGQKESTLDDYEAVPVQDFGLAMLRGMGWTPTEEQSKYKQPQLRPKGLGLGADKVINDNQKKKSANSKEEELALVKNSFVLITSGKYSGFYGKAVSLDEDNGRVMVDIPAKNETVSLSEFMLHPVTSAEYAKESKVINADKYVEYKRNEIQQLSKNRQKESSHKESNINHEDENTKDKKKVEKSNGSSRQEKESSRSTTPKTISRKKETGRSSSSEDRSYDRVKTEKPTNSSTYVRSNKRRERQRSSSIPKRSLNSRSINRSSSSEEDRYRHRSKIEKNDDKHRNSRKDKEDRRRCTSVSRDSSSNKRREYRSPSNNEDRLCDRRKVDKRNNSSDEELNSRNSRREKQTCTLVSKDRSRIRQRNSSSSEDRSDRQNKNRHRSLNERKNKEERYGSNDSLSSLSDSNKRSKKKDKSNDLDCDDYKSKKSTDGKRDIDKKRKGKKKKRDRDRSPNYKKYKK